MKNYNTIKTADGVHEQHTKKFICSGCDTTFYTSISGRTTIKCPVCGMHLYSSGEEVR